MKFIPRFDLSRRLVWLALLVAVLLVSGPLQGREEFNAGGKITAVDIVRRILEIDGSQYTLTQQPKIYTRSSENASEVDLNITDLRVGQYIEFKIHSNSISSIYVFEEDRLPE